MKFTLEMAMDNEAFDDSRELRTILTTIAVRVPGDPRPGDSGKVLDTNGNTVGSWSVTS